jgi:hypothetical protein
MVFRNAGIGHNRPTPRVARRSIVFNKA